MNNVQISKYGQRVKGIEFHSPSLRIDQYTSNSDGIVYHEHALCTGLKDMSDVYDGKYNPKCSACWLGYGHTINKHNQSLES